MKRRGFEMRQWLVVVFAAVLLAGAASVSLALGDAAQTAPPEPQKSDAGQGGCPNCCARAASEESAPGCARSGGGCCRGEGRQAKRGAGPRGQGGMGHGRMRHGGAAGGGAPAVMQTVRALVHDYRQDIERTVEEVENGVVTVTRAPSNPEAATAITRHVGEVKQLLEDGGRMRMWDPLFQEIFAHADEITMEIEALDDGVRVTETSDNPAVVALIQAHAHKVSEFIARGPAAVHEETPLPEGYEAAE